MLCGEICDDYLCYVDTFVIICCDEIVINMCFIVCKCEMNCVPTGCKKEGKKPAPGTIVCRELKQWLSANNGQLPYFAEGRLPAKHCSYHILPRAGPRLTTVHAGWKPRAGSWQTRRPPSVCAPRRHSRRLPALFCRELPAALGKV